MRSRSKTMAPRGSSTRASSLAVTRKVGETLTSDSSEHSVKTNGTATRSSRNVKKHPTKKRKLSKSPTAELPSKRKRNTETSPTKTKLDVEPKTPPKSAKKSGKLGIVTPPATPESTSPKKTSTRHKTVAVSSDKLETSSDEEQIDGAGLSATDDFGDSLGSPDDLSQVSNEDESDDRLAIDDDDDEDYKLTVDVDGDDTEDDKKDSKPKKPTPYDDADKHLIDISGDNETGKKFKCSFCGKTSACRADLKKHIRVHTGVRPHKCKICNASFIQITALRGHETIHSGQKPFACDVCDKTFAIKDRLRLHMRVHTGEKPYKCPQCNMTFARRSQIVQHAKIHSTDRCYRCDECSQTFTTYHMLQAHHNTHRGIKEFMCVACGKKFMRLEGMNKHIRTVHRGSRPYTCNVCGKSFKGHLQQHMRLHMGVRPFECNICKATFTQNSQLTVHMRIHTGDRPYKCQICGANFAHSSACKIHMRSHTGEKPFKCVLCDTSFAQLPHLKKHMRCVHDAEKPYLCTGCCDFFQTQQELDMHKQLFHGIKKTNEEEAEQTVEEATLARLRARLAVLLYRISSEERRAKFGFGKRIIDDVLKTSLKSSGHEPITDPEMSTLNELRQNVLLLLKWTIPIETMEEYHRNSMTVDEVLEMLTS